MSKRRAYVLAALMGTALAAVFLIAAFALSLAHRAQADTVIIDRRVTRIERPTPKAFDAKGTVEVSSTGTGASGEMRDTEPMM